MRFPGLASRVLETVKDPPPSPRLLPSHGAEPRATPPMTRTFLSALALVAVPAIPQLRAQEEAAPHPGKVIWEKHCVECHGKNGEGVMGKADDALHGERTLASLAKRIDKTMPEDNEELLDAAQSAQVAEYIYGAFYSQEARAKTQVVKQSFSRLTVSQFRNSVADLFGDPTNAWSKERGLSAKYSARWKAKDAEDDENDEEDEEKFRKEDFYRKDRQIAFNFGEQSPEPKLLPADNFNISWQGSIIAEETGLYEFTIRTQNGARLFVNNWRDPIIDGWVSSGPEPREEKGSIYLIGGRVYPIRLEHFKFKEKTSSIELLWKTPNGIAETVPQRNLFPYEVRETLVVSNSFPADDSSDGYPRGTSISKAWFDAVTSASMSAAETVGERLDAFIWTKKDDPERVNKIKAYLRRVASTAFRRNLSDEEAAALIEPRFANSDKPELAVKRVVLAILTSPQFLYPTLNEGEKPDQLAVASRLALSMWDSVPDRELLKAAEKGTLNDYGHVQAQARRMLYDPRAKEKLHGFFTQWLSLKDVTAIAKDPEAFPDLNDAVLSDLRRSLFVFIDDIVWSGGSDYRQLLSADYMVLNDRLAKFYQKDPVGPDFTKVELPGSQRSGVLTHPYLLTSFAYFKDTSPIHRGVFLTRAIVGRALKPPPEAVEFKDGHFDPTLTMREKVTDVTRSAACMGCHSEINPLGFALEKYDAVGRWREMDNNKPVDTASDYPDDNGGTVRIATPKDIANFAIGSQSSRKNFVRHLFQHTNKQPVGAYGQGMMDQLTRKFGDSGFNIQQLLVESVLVSATEGAELGKPKETASN